MYSVCRRHCRLSFSWLSASSSKIFMHQASCFHHTYCDLFSQAFPTHTQPVTIKAVLHNHNDRESFRLSNSPPNSPQKSHSAHNDHFTLPDPSELIVKHYFNNTLTLANNYFHKENPLLTEKWRGNKASKQVRVGGGHNKGKIKKNEAMWVWFKLS